jgi:hypothetical protein
MNNQFDCGPVLDEAGNIVEDANVLVLALTPKKLTVECEGLVYTAWALRNKVPFRLTELRSALYTALLFQAGFTQADLSLLFRGADNESPEEEAARVARLEADARYGAWQKLLNESSDYARVKADIAASALLSTNAPGLRGKDKFTGDDLLGLGRIGEALIAALSNFTQSSALASNEAGAMETEAAEAAAKPTPTKVNTKKKSPTSPASTTARPPAT